MALVGPPASGKSTIGAALAFRLGVAFLDTDQMVESVAGKPSEDIFVEFGEAEFRRIEADQVLAALRQPDAIVAVGSGAVQTEQVAQALADVTVVRLQVAHGVSAKRAGLSGPRPVALGNVLTQWRKMIAERDPIYERLATITIDSGEHPVSECVEALAVALAVGEQPD
ncbi:MAG: (d)CMP kinase [Actinomycetia bacterium]|nr:(d)CMP kinase [Actinomycetes bacterium]